MAAHIDDIDTLITSEKFQLSKQVVITYVDKILFDNNLVSAEIRDQLDFKKMMDMGDRYLVALFSNDHDSEKKLKNIFIATIAYFGNQLNPAGITKLLRCFNQVKQMLFEMREKSQVIPAERLAEVLAELEELTSLAKIMEATAKLHEARQLLDAIPKERLAELAELEALTVLTNTILDDRHAELTQHRAQRFQELHAKTSTIKTLFEQQQVAMDAMLRAEAEDTIKIYTNFCNTMDGANTPEAPDVPLEPLLLMIPVLRLDVVRRASEQEMRRTQEEDNRIRQRQEENLRSQAAARAAEEEQQQSSRRQYSGLQLR